jgi:hypothetical protein
MKLYEGLCANNLTKIGPNHGGKAIFFSKTRKILLSKPKIAQKPNTLSSLQNWYFLLLKHVFFILTSYITITKYV